MCAFLLGLGPRAELLGCRVSMCLAIGDPSKQLPKAVSSSHAMSRLFQTPFHTWPRPSFSLQSYLTSRAFPRRPTTWEHPVIFPGRMDDSRYEGLVLKGLLILKRGLSVFSLTDFSEFVIYSGHEFFPGRAHCRVSSPPGLPLEAPGDVAS